jgi:hypothetical protein
MKKILHSIAILFLASSGLFAQVFYDGFTGTGTIGSAEAVVGSTENGWTTHSGTKVGTIDIQSGSLTYDGLLESTGNKVLVPGDNTNVPRDVNAPVTVTGTVAYYSALINVIDNTQLLATYDYFMSLGQTSGSAVTVLAGRLGIKAVTASTTEYQLGILNQSGGTPVYVDWTTTMSFGTTYLVVIKVDASTSPVTAQLWVNPATLGGSEPLGSVSNNSGTNLITEFKSVCIRNGSGTPKANIDEIRVGTTFADVTPLGTTAPSLTLSETSLADFGSIVAGTAGYVEGSFNISGINLTDNIVITPVAGFDISTVSGAGFSATNPITLVPVSGTVASTPIYVKFHPAAAQSYTGNITIASTGVTPDKAVAVSGTGIISDVTAPSFVASYPKAANIVTGGFDLVVQIDEPGKVWFVALASDVAAPSIADIMSTGTLITVAAANTDYSAVITGLTTNTSYNVYMVAADNETIPNVQSNFTTLQVTTAMQLEVLLNVSFEADLAPFTAVSVAGAQVWTQASYSGNGYAKMSGYASGNQDNEDWLISPAIDLDASTNNILSFLTAANFTGPDIAVLISSDFTGTYDAASIAAATWTNITSQVSLSAGAYAWVESGNVDLSTYSGTIYVAFKYLSTVADGAKTYEIDDFKIQGVLKPGSDATLSDLTMDGTTITGFDAAKLSYTIQLPMGTSIIPVVAYTINDADATAAITAATDLAGNNAARTTSVVVTAQDGTTIQTYTILFDPILEAPTLSVFRAGDPTRTYVVTGEVLLTYQNSSRNQKYLQDATGGVMIDDPSAIITTSYAVGDKIAGLKGKILVYNGLIEFVPSADPGAPVSSGNPVEPVEITIAQFNGELNTYESRLVTLNNVIFELANGGAIALTKANYNFTVDGVAGVLRTNYLDLDYMGGFLPWKAAVTGIVIQYKGTAQIVPRSAMDFYVYSNDSTLSSISVNGNPLTGFNSEYYDYAVTLPKGVLSIPVITYTPTNDKATVVVTNATDLSGDLAARTATIQVTSEDGVSNPVYSIVFSLYVPATDASLSDLKLDGTTVTGFATGTVSYSVTFPFGTATVPAVTYTLTDSKATAVVTNASNLNGTEAERTTKVVVTADDGIATKTYSIVFAITPASTDASLSSLSAGGTAVTGFVPGTLSYAVLLPVGTTSVPALTYSVTDANATAVVTDATDLFGTEAQRTSKVAVTAEDGTTVKNYTIVFTVDNTGFANNGAVRLSIYPVPAIDEIKISGLAKVNRLEIMDITGKILRKVEITGEEVTLNISNLSKGMYFLKTESQTLKFIKK